MKLFLIDAYAFIYRAYYAFMKNPRINSQGVNTSAIFGFVNTLEDVLKRENPTHIGVAFDPAGPTFRHEAYEQYKAQREESPEVIKMSAPIIRDIIRAYNIPVLEVAGFEADDVIGTIASKAATAFDVYMMTPDKDYGQLVAPHIFMYRPKFGSSEFEILGEKEVKAKYKLDSPLQMIDYLGLMGDKADNIPGCPGVGEVTAQKLIAQFGSIENLLANTSQLTGTLRTRVEENAEMIRFSRFLATIRTDVPIDFIPDDFARKEIDEPALRKIFEELEFRTLESRVFKTAAPQNAPSGAISVKGGMLDLFGDTVEDTNQPITTKLDETSQASLNTLKTTATRYRLLTSSADFTSLVAQIKSRRFVSFDTETTGIDPLQAELVGMSFATNEGEACYIPVSANRAEALKTTGFFKEILESGEILKIGQNLKYDINVMKKYGIRVSGPMFDTMVAHYLLNPDNRHNLDYMAETMLHYQTIHIEELIGAKGKNQLNMRQLPPEQIVDYAAEDADVALRLKTLLEKQIADTDFANLLYNIELPLVAVLADMEETGVRIDTEALRQSSAVLSECLSNIEKEIYQSAGLTFNINSPKMVGDVLFEHLKIDAKARKTGKTGQYQTGEEVLEKLKTRHPVVEKILNYRKIKKLLSTYTDALPALVSPVDGKVHTTYNQTVVATGRLSSTNPNLQNIPVRDEEGREIRKAFIPDPDCIFLSADYSQIELRIMAHLSEDPAMIEAFQSGHDIHAATAARIYNVPIEEVTRQMRGKAKSANFGIIYGISAFGLAEQLSISRSEARELIDGYFATYPQVKTYIERSIALTRERGYAETIFHRRRYLPDIASANAIVRGYAERNAVNAPIQGSAADIIKIAMNAIYRRFGEENLRSRMIMQVHDELNFNVVRDELERVKTIVVGEMENAVKLKVPLVADCGVGANWLEAH